VAELLFLALDFIQLLWTVQPFEALRTIAVLRYHRDDDSNEGDITNASQAKSLSLFILAFLQATKLFVCTGIPWTQASTVVFILSYVVELLLRQVAAVTPGHVLTKLRSANGSSKGKFDEDNFSYPILWYSLAAFALQYFFWFAVVAQALPKAIDEPPHAGIDATYKWGRRIVGLIINMIQSACIVPFLLFFHSLLESNSIMHLMEAAIVARYSEIAWTWTHRSILTICLLLGSSATWVSHDARMEILEPFMFRAAIATVLLPLSFLVVYACLRLVFATPVRRWLFSRNSRPRPTADVGCHHLSIVLIQISVTLLYYCRVYDPEGTYKPNWAEYLG
jgi:hypothetical protein